jgi:hypothetical protein
MKRTDVFQSTINQIPICSWSHFSFICVVTKLEDQDAIKRSSVLLFRVTLTHILKKISNPLNYERSFRPKSVHLGKKCPRTFLCLSHYPYCVYSRGNYSEFYSTPTKKSLEVKLLQKRKA